MTDKEKLDKLAAEIKGLRKEVKDNIAELGNSESERIGLFKDLEIYDNILSLIDSMQEEPVSEDDYAKEILSWEDSHEDWDRYVIRKTAKHFTDWQKEQMEKKAFPVEIGRMRSDYKCMLHGNFSNCNTGDKVKVIIIK